MMLKIFLPLLTGVCLLGGCSAPHDNPFDPESDRYRPASSPADLTARVRSMHVSRNFPTTDSYSVVAELDGPDASLLDSVWVSYAGGATVSLSHTSDNLWATIFAASYFGDATLGSVIGRPFLFTTRRDVTIQTIGPVYLFRVIESVPQVTSPTANDTVESRPTLVWPSFSAAFPFSYMAKVINITEGFETEAWVSPRLPSSVLSARPPDPLPDGRYYWTLTVLDSFDNSSRSKEAAFTVLDGSAIAGHPCSGPTTERR